MRGSAATRSPSRTAQRGSSSTGRGRGRRAVHSGGRFAPADPLGIDHPPEQDQLCSEPGPAIPPRTGQPGAVSLLGRRPATRWPGGARDRRWPPPLAREQATEQPASTHPVDADRPAATKSTRRGGRGVEVLRHAREDAAPSVSRSTLPGATIRVLSPGLSWWSPSALLSLGGSCCQGSSTTSEPRRRGRGAGHAVPGRQRGSQSPGGASPAHPRRVLASLRPRRRHRRLGPA